MRLEHSLRVQRVLPLLRQMLLGAPYHLDWRCGNEPTYTPRFARI
jgi:hypothetical protein